MEEHGSRNTVEVELPLRVLRFISFLQFQAVLPPPTLRLTYAYPVPSSSHATRFEKGFFFCFNLMRSTLINSYCGLTVGQALY